MPLVDPALSPRQSRELLADLGDLRQVGRRAPGPPWLPLLLFGALTTLSAGLAAAFGTWWLGPFWIVGGVLVFVVLVRHHRRHSVRAGISGRGRELLMGSAATFVVCFAIAAIAGPSEGRVGPLLGPPALVVLSYAWYGWYRGSWETALVTVPGAAASGLLFAAGGPDWAVLLAFGLGLLGAGAFVVAREQIA